MRAGWGLERLRVGNGREGGDRGGEEGGVEG